MLRHWPAALCMALVDSAYGQAPAPAAPKAAPEPSAYCRSSAQILFQGGASDGDIAAVAKICRRGDVIAISTSAQGSVF